MWRYYIKLVNSLSENTPAAESRHNLHFSDHFLFNMLWETTNCNK